MNPRVLLAVDVGGSKKGCSGAWFDGPELRRVGGRLLPAREYAAPPGTVVVERPQQDGRSRAVPPAILMDLAWTGAFLVGGFAALGATVREVEPREWKGDLQKAIHHSRIVEALTRSEIAVIGLAALEEVTAAVTKGALCRWRPDSNGHYRKGSSTPDILDAVGLGLWHLGRIGKDGYAK